MIADRIAGAPISWGVCEVPGWGYQLSAERVLAEMAEAGLRATEFGPDGFLPDDPGERRALLKEMFPPDDFPIYFYRWPKAPDLMIAPDELDVDAIAGAGVFWATLTGLSAEPSRSAHHAAWQARSRAPHTVLDLDYRPQFWESRTAAGRAARLALPHVTVAVGNLDECYTAVGERDAHLAAEALLGLGPELVVVKLGADGVLARTAAETLETAAPTVKVLNGLGAGDAFGGALCHGLLEGWPLERTLRFANAAGALVAARIECSTAMPETGEVLAALEAGDA